jgi:hypothetical protein
LVIAKGKDIETQYDKESLAGNVTTCVTPHDYVSNNGLTKEALEQLSDEDIIHGGYLWALDTLEPLRKKYTFDSPYYVFGTDEAIEEDCITLYGIGTLYEEIQNGGFGQFVVNHADESLITLAALKEVGAVKTADAIEKAVAYYNSHQNSSNSELIARAQDVFGDELYEEFESEFDDYIAKTAAYLREKSIKNGGSGVGN